MPKQIHWLLPIFVALLSVTLLTSHATSAAAAVRASDLPNRQGLLIDLGRKPLTTQTIEQIIRAAADRNFNYVVLNLSDNEHLSFQSKYLKNRASKTVLSPKALKKLVSVAKAANVQLVPAVDVPAHAGAILRQLKRSRPKLYRQVKLDKQTLDYTAPQTTALVKTLYRELDASFKNQSRHDFLLGADEVPGSEKVYRLLTTFINRINKFQNQRGFTTIVWNDSLLKSELPKLNKNIVINYWSQSGNRAGAKTLTNRRAKRVSVSNLVRAKRPIVNANSYATYYQFKHIGNPINDQYFIDYLRDTYRPNMFNEISAAHKNQHQTIEPGVKTTGTLVSLWGHDAQKVKPATIPAFIRRLTLPTVN